MARTLMLALALLVAAAVPVQAMDREVHDWGGHDREVHDWRGHVDHDRYHRFERHPYYAYGTNPYGYVYTPQCSWEPAHWINQVIPNNEYGGYAYAPQYIPGQWICP